MLLFNNYSISKNSARRFITIFIEPVCCKSIPAYCMPERIKVRVLNLYADRRMTASLGEEQPAPAVAHQ